MKRSVEMPGKLCHKSVANLVSRAGFKGRFALEPLSGGANNRVFRVKVNGQVLLLKSYFKHPADKRDRLRAEFSFCKFAWDKGLRCLPRPFACDPEKQLGLYEFIEGERIRPAGVNEDLVRQALDFFRELNRHKQSPQADELPVASEACFSVLGHLQCIKRRVQNLAAIEGASPIDRKAAAFVRNRLLKAWETISGKILDQAASKGIAVDKEISQEERCLSPSDFGFHNAFMLPDGSLRFIDFEYSGWDDPAKTVCDFFCAPEVPVPMRYFNGFMKEIAERAATLFPAYQVKWCCIVLNEFQTVGAQRRLFAAKGADLKRRKALQLEKAEHMLDKIAL